MLNACKKCLNATDHPFGLDLDEAGLCAACTSEKTWEHADLHAQFFEKRSRSAYDCLVVLNGTPEDYFVVQRVLECGKYPLLYFVNNYFCNEVAWKNIHGIIEHYDLELRTYSPDIRLYRKLVGYSFRKYEDVFLPHKLMRFFKSYELAHQQNVGLIVSGEMQTWHTVGKFRPIDHVENTKWNFEQHEIGNRNSENLWDTGIDVNRDELRSSIPIQCYSRGIKWKFLSNYCKWDQWQQDRDMVASGAIAALNNGTFDFAYRAGNSVYYEVQDLLRHKKFRHYKLRDHLSREIRAGRIGRDNAALVYERFCKTRKFHIDPFFEWLGVTASGIDWLKYHLFRNYEFTDKEFTLDIDWREYFDDYLEIPAQESKEHHVLMLKGY